MNVPILSLGFIFIDNFPTAFSFLPVWSVHNADLFLLNSPQLLYISLSTTGMSFYCVLLTVGAIVSVVYACGSKWRSRFLFFVINVHCTRYNSFPFFNPPIANVCATIAFQPSQRGSESSSRSSSCSKLSSGLMFPSCCSVIVVARPFCPSSVYVSFASHCISFGSITTTISNDVIF